MTEKRQLLEPGAYDGAGPMVDAQARLSTAISLKRIADALETRRVAAATAVQDLANAAAATGGTMVLDVYTLADGNQSAHAVATWEDPDESTAA